MLRSQEGKMTYYVFFQLIIIRHKGHIICDYKKQLHWLPVPARIQFKLMATTWKAINEQAPKYIQQPIHRKPQTNFNLKSSSTLLLSEPVSHTGTSAPMLHSLNTHIYIKGTHAMPVIYEFCSVRTNMIIGSNNC